MTKTKISLLAIMFLTITLSAQAQSPCGDPAASQFDFWVGNWKLTWTNQQEEEITGSNKIQKILGSCVIEENFDDPSRNFIGKSVSVYSSRLGKWLQTWVDNSGAYLDFVGGMVDDKMILSRSFTNLNNQIIMQRMIFYNIEDNSFDWNWERSLDGGENWELRWKIHYERKM